MSEKVRFCKRCQKDTLWYTSGSGRCIPCNVIKNQRYHASHPNRKREAYSKDPSGSLAASRKWREHNPDRARKKERQWYKNHKEHAENTRLLREFGITLADKIRMLDEQKNKCKNVHCPRIFKSRSDAHVDHNHTTKEIRGLLCGNCNRALGMLHEDPAVIRGLTEYIEGFL